MGNAWERDQSLGSEAGRLNLSRLGQSYFIHASLECPSSVRAQGAVVARMARAEGMDSSALFAALIADGRRMQGIKDAAESMHIQRGVRTADTSPEHVRGVVESVFGHAYQMRTLDTAELEFITSSMYPEVKKTDPLHSEEIMEKRVDSMIEIAKKRELIRRGVDSPNI